MSRAQERSRQAAPAQVEFRAVRRTTLLLMLLCWVTFFAGLGRPAIGDSDEAFYAEAGREMLASGDWLTPHYNYDVRFQKPILLYWLVAASYRVLGVTEAAARTFPALSGFALSLFDRGHRAPLVRRADGARLRTHSGDRLRLLLYRPPGAARPPAGVHDDTLDLGCAPRDARR